MFPAMRTVSVDLGERSYDVLVDAGLLAQAGERIRERLPKARRVAVITDSRVERLHGGCLLGALEAAGLAHSVHVIPAGESSKSMSQAECVCREMIRAGHDRGSVVVALGGGVTGDLAGFVAAIFYRGVPFVQIPTTIVSQVDSSVGGKTGVNAEEGKNLLGAFHQPALVLVDPETLCTLPEREFREGFSEVIKHAAIRDAGMLEELAALGPVDRAVPHDLIARNIAIKARIVEADEQETSGLRALLNFGHTIGHGIEAAVPYGQLLHGEAISLGMRAALWISEKRAGLCPAERDRVLAVIRHFGLPLVLPEIVDAGRVMEKLATDKKFSGGKIRFVVLEEAGRARLTDQVTGEDLREAIDFLRFEV